MAVELFVAAHASLQVVADEELMEEGPVGGAVHGQEPGQRQGQQQGQPPGQGAEPDPELTGTCMDILRGVAAGAVDQGQASEDQPRQYQADGPLEQDGGSECKPAHEQPSLAGPAARLGGQQEGDDGPGRGGGERHVDAAHSGQPGEADHRGQQQHGQQGGPGASLLPEPSANGSQAQEGGAGRREPDRRAVEALAELLLQPADAGHEPIKERGLLQFGAAVAQGEMDPLAGGQDAFPVLGGASLMAAPEVALPRVMEEEQIEQNGCRAQGRQAAAESGQAWRGRRGHGLGRLALELDFM